MHIFFTMLPTFGNIHLLGVYICHPVGDMQMHSIALDHYGFTGGPQMKTNKVYVRI